MADPATALAPPEGATGVLVLADGTAIWGHGFGATGEAVGELCFNTAMTGYQEVLTDPSYAAQIVTFTFPHIGNVGANAEDVESFVESAVGCVVREMPTVPSSFRSEEAAGRVDDTRWQDRAGGGGYARADPAHPPWAECPQRGDRAFGGRRVRCRGCWRRARARLAGAGGHGPRLARVSREG